MRNTFSNSISIFANCDLQSAQNVVSDMRCERVGRSYLQATLSSATGLYLRLLRLIGQTMAAWLGRLAEKQAALVALLCGLAEMHQPIPVGSVGPTAPFGPTADGAIAST